MTPVRMLWKQVFSIVVLTAAVTHVRAQVSTDPTHIEIVMRSDSELSQRNLRLSMGNSNIPFQLTKAKKGSIATHLLIVLPVPLAACAQSASPAELSAPLGKGWSVAIAGSDHQWTRWVSGADAWSVACASAGDAISGDEGPIRMLQEQVGRRVLLFAGRPLQGDLQEAIAELPEIFIVERPHGGGKVRYMLPPNGQPMDPFPGLTPVPVAYAPQNTGQAETPRQYFSSADQPSPGPHANFTNGVIKTQSLDAALKAIQRAAGSYYDVAFSIPTGAPLAAPIQLNFRLNVEEYRAYTDIYAELQNAKPDAEVRTAVPVSLVTR